MGDDMEESVETGNSATSNGTAEVNAAGTNSNNNIEKIMGDMTGGQPDAKPENGDKAKGSENESQKQAEIPAWTSQLSDDLKNNPDFIKRVSKFGKISDLAKSYSELETKLGNSIVRPGKDASDEEKEAFYRQLGKPESRDKYSISDKENADLFKDIAFKNNLTDDQATALFGTFKEIGIKAIQQEQMRKAAHAKATDDALRAEWGNNYNAKITMLQRGVNTYGGKALGEKLKASGLLFDADVVKMFVKLGEEAADAGTSGRTSGGESYKPTSEGGHFSWIEQQFKK